MTGALSPVIALSSTEATPSMTSPSPGMKSPASTSTTSPLRRLRRRRPSSTSRRVAARASFFATVSLRALLSDVGLRLAAALGHRLGEVGEQHREPQPERNREDEAGGRLALADERLDATGSSSGCCRRRRRTSPGCATGARRRVSAERSRRSPASIRSQARRTRTACASPGAAQSRCAFRESLRDQLPAYQEQSARRSARARARERR